MSPVPPLPVSDADVHAYADGQLPPARAAAIEARCADDAQFAARITEIRAQNAALRDALDPMLAEPVPPQLLAAAMAPTQARREQRWLAPAVAAAAALLIGLGVGWLGRDALIERSGTPTTFARQAAFAHALYATDVNRPVEIWAADEKRLVAWLTKRLGFQVHAPDLNSLGYALVGGRLVAGNEMPTALFMYENADRQRLSLQVRKQAAGPGESAFRYAVENGVGVFYWIDESCGYAISGNVDRAQLMKIAHVVYGQLAAFETARSK
jgi:anti-sigma factor RsiW